MSIDTIAVVGTGAMGSGIIEVAAKAGIEVVAYDIDATAIEAGKSRVEKSLAKAVERGKLDEISHTEALARMAWTTDLADAHRCQLAVEAAPEVLDLKLGIFAQLDEVLPANAVMATNTSSIPIIDIAMGTTRPEQVCGMHFFNPATVMRLDDPARTSMWHALFQSSDRDAARGSHFHATHQS